MCVCIVQIQSPVHALFFSGGRTVCVRIVQIQSPVHDLSIFCRGLHRVRSYCSDSVTCPRPIYFSQGAAPCAFVAFIFNHLSTNFSSSSFFFFFPLFFFSFFFAGDHIAGIRSVQIQSSVRLSFCSGSHRECPGVQSQSSVHHLFLQGAAL